MDLNFLTNADVALLRRLIGMMRSGQMDHLLAAGPGAPFDDGFFTDETHVVFTEDAVPARDAYTPGTAECPVYRVIDGVLEEAPRDPLTIYNLSRNQILAGQFIKVVRDKYSEAWLTDGELAESTSEAGTGTGTAVGGGGSTDYATLTQVGIVSTDGDGPDPQQFSGVKEFHDVVVMADTATPSSIVLQFRLGTNENCNVAAGALFDGVKQVSLSAGRDSPGPVTTLLVDSAGSVTRPGGVIAFGAIGANNFPDLYLFHDTDNFTAASGTDPVGNVFQSGILRTLGGGGGSFATEAYADAAAASAESNANSYTDTEIAALSSVYQPLDADLTALAALASTGFAERTGANTWTTRTLVVGDLPELHGFTNATPGDSDRFPFYKDSTGNRDCSASELADYVLGKLTAANLPALNGFTNATPADDDRVPFYDDGAGANRDCSALELKTYCNPLIVLRDEKTQNTDGGTFTSGAWRTRDLNTEVVDTGGDCSLSSNQFTLTAGTYEIIAVAPAALVNRHQIRLQNVTDGTTVLTGKPSISGASDNTQTDSILLGRFTIGASKALEIQHQCQTTYGTSGFGLAANFTTEVYTVVALRRVA